MEYKYIFYGSQNVALYDLWHKTFYWVLCTGEYFAYVYLHTIYSIVAFF